MKGFQADGATFGPEHATSIVNDGQATTADIRVLIAPAKGRVAARFGVGFRREVGATEESSSSESAVATAGEGERRVDEENRRGAFGGWWEDRDAEAVSTATGAADAFLDALATDGGWRFLAGGTGLYGEDGIPMWGIRVVLYAEAGRERVVSRPVERAFGAPWTRLAIEGLVAELRARGVRGRVEAADAGGMVFIRELLP
jgi:hypothetical protein